MTNRTEAIKLLNAYVEHGREVDTAGVLLPAIALALLDIADAIREQKTNPVAYTVTEHLDDMGDVEQWLEDRSRHRKAQAKEPPARINPDAMVPETGRRRS